MIQRFSPTEIRHLTISWLALAVIFTIPQGLNLFTFVLIAFTLGIAFIGHELAHKFVAQNYGFWAQYRMDPGNLFFAFFLAIITSMAGFPIIFAAPGAVVIFPITRTGRTAGSQESGIISIAGPTANLIFASIFAILLLITPQGTGLLTAFARTGLWINSFLALFNLLPFGVLDGAKIFRWNSKIWAATAFLAIIALSLAY